MYKKMIAEILTRMRVSFDPAEVEEAMRDEYRTLDHLSGRQFTAAVKRAVKVLEASKASPVLTPINPWRKAILRDGEPEKKPELPYKKGDRVRLLVDCEGEGHHYLKDEEGKWAEIVAPAGSMGTVVCDGTPKVRGTQKGALAYFANIVMDAGVFAPKYRPEAHRVRVDHTHFEVVRETGEEKPK